LKELKNMASFQVTNLAKFLAHLVIQKGIPLSVLKVSSDLTTGCMPEELWVDY
jgi:hypothetical protein